MRRFLLTATPVSCIAFLALGCADGDEAVQLNISNGEGSLGAVSLAVSATDAAGEPIEMTQRNTSVVVETRASDGPWQAVPSAELDFQGPSRLDIMVVADNSGSEEGQIGTIQDSLEDFSALMLRRGQRDRVGLVRVSTVARPVQALTEDEAEIDSAIAELFVTNGWTALWDGVRLSNEMLEEASIVPTPRGNRPRVCIDRAFRAIVAFTDGKDNNSADEHDTRYEGDGIDTTLDDLKTLHVRNSPTPVYTIGIGNEIDAEALEELSDATGGNFRYLASMGQLHGELISTAARLTSQVPLCFEVPDCGHTESRITLSVDHQGQSFSRTLVLDLPHDTCN